MNRVGVDYLRERAGASKYLLFVVLTISLSLYSTRAAAVFVVSAEDDCSGSSVYAYSFSQNLLPQPSYVIAVSESPMMPDITMLLVQEPGLADLVFVDGALSANMRVCKQVQGLGSRATVIRVSSSSGLPMPDVTVKLSKSSLVDPDYRIYISSKRFTAEQAAALFAVIWKGNRRRR